MTLCYYVTGHGYGHAVRTAQILKALPRDLPLILRTTVPERLFREEVPGRDFLYVPAEFDCGCLQSDSVTVLPRATLDRYAHLATVNEASLGDEVAFLRRHAVDTIVTDIASFPLRAAAEADIPAYAVANFTWHDIYQDYVETAEDRALLDRMVGEYSRATTAFLTPLATPTVGGVFERVEHVPLVTRRGVNVRAALSGLATPGTHLALLYLGVWGMDVDWGALGRIGGWTFLTFEPPPVWTSNVIVLDRRDWSYTDTAASVDAVVSKAGYGTVTECIANGVPLVYVPRASFAEYDALVAGMDRWAGVAVPDAEFRAGQWAGALADALCARPDHSAYAVNGADVIAGRLIGADARE